MTREAARELVTGEVGLGLRGRIKEVPLVERGVAMELEQRSGMAIRA